MNKYTLEVYKKGKNPCYVVTIRHIMLAGVYFFNSLKKANEFVHNAKNELAIFGELTYNENGNTDEGFAKVIHMVLSCDNLKIGENGKTFYSES